jgi:hypothetical protein
MRQKTGEGGIKSECFVPMPQSAVPMSEQIIPMSEQIIWLTIGLAVAFGSV